MLEIHAARAVRYMLYTRTRGITALPRNTNSNHWVSKACCSISGRSKIVDYGSNAYNDVVDDVNDANNDDVDDSDYVYDDSDYVYDDNVYGDHVSPTSMISSI